MKDSLEWFSVERPPGTRTIARVLVAECLPPHIDDDEELAT